VRRTRCDGLDPTYCIARGWGRAGLGSAIAELSGAVVTPAASPTGRCQRAGEGRTRRDVSNAAQDVARGRVERIESCITELSEAVITQQRTPPAVVSTQVDDSPAVMAATPLRTSLVVGVERD